uniref:NADH dehydrogenase subunit 5 n=1 Tax=Ascaris lumbricoides TaxID=6252 RepID=A0A0M3I1F1_ASCLU
LLSVSVPFRYSSFSTLYAWALIGSSIFISTLVSILSLYYVYSQKIQPQRFDRQFNLIYSMFIQYL